MLGQAPRLAGHIFPGSVSCHQTGGGQYIDVGVIDLVKDPDRVGDRSR